jgi:hypothetical protein
MASALGSTFLTGSGWAGCCSWSLNCFLRSSMVSSSSIIAYAAAASRSCKSLTTAGKSTTGSSVVLIGDTGTDFRLSTSTTSATPTEVTTSPAATSGSVAMAGVFYSPLAALTKVCWRVSSCAVKSLTRTVCRLSAVPVYCTLLSQASSSEIARPPAFSLLSLSSLTVLNLA